MRLRKRDRSFLEIAAENTPMVAAQTDLGTFLVNPADRSKAALFAGGRVDDANLDAALRVAREAGLQPGGTFVDVGAHIGLLTVAALRRHGFERALAVEAEPANFRLLRVNLAANDLDAAVSAVNVAASETPGTARLRVNAAQHGKHALLPADDARERTDVVEVPTRPLDDLLAERGVTGVGFLKIDTEGHEASVLRGAPGLLAASPPTLVEYAPFRLGAQPGGIEGFEAVVRAHFTRFADVRAGTPVQPVDALEGMRGVYDGEGGRRRVTDLLLLP